MAEPADPRLTPARADLAAAKLEGKVDAERFVEGQAMQVRAPYAPLHAQPDAETALDTVLLFGERFDVYDSRGGWVWGQAQTDGYVGYVPEAAFSPDLLEDTHIVAVPTAHLYRSESIKTEPVGMLWMTSRLSVASASDAFVQLVDGLYLPVQYVLPVDQTEPDFVAVAEMFMHAPYLWGGRTVAGLDCSALVQIAMARSGIPVLRDSDMQANSIGDPISPGDTLTRGDLLFWKGHVGIMSDAETLLHCTGHWMRTVKEPVAEVRRRIEETLGVPLAGMRRLN